MSKQFSEANPRFVAKVKDTKRPRVFSVYDRERASYPTLVPGLGAVEQEGTEEEMTAEAHRVAQHYERGFLR